jgi:hypothetical protein
MNEKPANTKGQQTTNPQKIRTSSRGDELDSLNTALRRKRGGAQAIRRRMEAQIDSKARKRRSAEPNASAALSSLKSKPGR